MTIRGLDAWLTTPPEEPDVLELADEALKYRDKRLAQGHEIDEELLYLLSLVEGLRQIIKNDLGI